MGWQDVDGMIMADAAAEWERINEADPMEEKIKKAAEFINGAMSLVDEALDELVCAVDELYDTPMADKVQSFYDQFFDLNGKLNLLNEHYERGERE